MICIFVLCFLQESSAWVSNLYSSRYSLNLASSNDDKLFDQMRSVLGEREDIFADAEKDSQQVMQGLKQLDRDANVNVNNKFIEWLDSNGVWVKTDSAW